jgi:di/tricarboxylate transporter
MTLPLWAQAAITLVVLGAAIYSFARERLPADVTALSALLALLLTGVLSVSEAFAGFSHPATLSVAAVLVLSAGVERTGALRFLARRILAPLGRSELALTLALMVVVGGLSAFVNNTAAVAVFIPIVLEVCARSGARPGRVLMPMAYAATLGGMCTLIGTSTNLAAHEYARGQGLPGFGMFELGQVGLPMALAGFAYMLLVGRWFLPAGSETPLALERGGSYLAALIVTPGSRWIGRPVQAERLRQDLDVELVEVMRDKHSLLAGEEPPRYQAGDRLRVRGRLQDVMALVAQGGLEIHRPASMAVAEARESGPAARGRQAVGEVVVLPASSLIGRSLRSSRFAERFDTVVLALHRPRAQLQDRPEDIPIRAGDLLVVEGEPAALRGLAETPGFLLVGTPAMPEAQPQKVGLALLILGGVVLSAALGVPIVVAASAGCATLILSRCLRPHEAYRAIDLGIIVLLAGALAIGTALEKTGLAALAGSMIAGLGDLTGPYGVLGAFFVLAMVLSEVMSNSGTVLLLAPVAVASAQQTGVNPLALLAAVTFGSSAAFAMPIGYQTSLMVYGPGGYRFRDFMRMGIPLDLLLAAIALWLIPRCWPLS